MSLPVPQLLERARDLAARGADAEVLACLRATPAPGDDDDAACRGQLVEALSMRQRSLMRLGRYADAVKLGAEALPALLGEADAGARARILTSMAHAYCQMSLPEASLRCASAACRLALREGHTQVAASALECVGIGYASLGDCPQGERLMLEALGMVLQTGDDAAIQMRLLNLMYLSGLLYGAYVAAGDAARAQLTLERCARFAAQGDKLRNRPGVGVWERCLWRANKAGWLRRRGDRPQARADFEAARAEAVAHGWTAIERVANFELALIHRDDGRADEALELLRGIPTGEEDAADAYDMSLGAHLVMRDMLLARQQPAEARVHELAWRRLRARRDSRSADANQRLGDLSEVVLGALAESDRDRLDTEIQRLRGEAGAPGPGLFSARRAG